MDFLQLAAERYSVRKFTDEAVRGADLDKILRAGHLAPTACNKQPQRILVIDGGAGIEKLKESTKCHFETKTALLVCYDRDLCWRRSYDGKPSGDIDASIVTTHMMLEAASIGVGSTWVMHFDPAAMRKNFAVPENYEMTALLVLGYPAKDAAPYPGHGEFAPINELVFHNEF